MCGSCSVRGQGTARRPPSPDETPFLLGELCARYDEAQAEGAAHPLVLIGAFVLDLLAIHPFADGNGRVARLVTTYLLMQAGYGVPRYVSVEQRIFETKNSEGARDAGRRVGEVRPRGCACLAQSAIAVCILS